MPLIAFFDKNGFGFVNSTTFDIIIPGQYKEITNFVGGFAIVNNNNRRGNASIINTENTEIIRGAHWARLFTSEDGNIVFALTENYSGLGERGSWRSPGRKPQFTTYRLYNLNTGKLEYKYSTWFRGYGLVDIMLIDNYLIKKTVNNDWKEINLVFRINNDSTLEKIEAEVNELMENIIAERNLQRIENDFHFNDELTFDPYFWYVADKLDIEQLLENVPENLILSGMSAQNSWRFRTEKQIYDIKPINRNLVYPLKRTRILYEVELTSNVEIKGRNTFRGLYCAIDNNWVIYPRQDDFWLDVFSQTEFPEWIRRGTWFYNISTKVRYREKFGIEYFGGMFGTTLLYMGYIDWHRINYDQDMGETFR
jgi:hypothetical protein